MQDKPMKTSIKPMLILITVMLLTYCEKPVTVPPADEPPPDGYVFIDSYPKGMQIFMDNKERRRITPDSITWLSEKEYKFTF